jgi:t-SNARE complex subunit (syntaxin)
LSADDVFRSQFRTETDAPPSSLDVLSWGLQHIERLRKANLEAREEAIKRWQLWSVIILSIVNIVVTLLKK